MRQTRRHGEGMELGMGVGATAAPGRRQVFMPEKEEAGAGVNRRQGLTDPLSCAEAMASDRAFCQTTLSSTA